MAANCSMAGMTFGFPDVCNIPTPAGPVPTPFPNLALRPTALPPTTSLNHLIGMFPSHNLATVIPLTQGDSAGIAGGVLSGTIMGPSRNLLGSAKVFTGGAPATTLLHASLSNQNNCPAVTLVPAQSNVFYFS